MQGRLIVHILNAEDHELMEDFIVNADSQETQDLIDRAGEIREVVEMEFEVEENDPED